VRGRTPRRSRKRRRLAPAARREEILTAALRAFVRGGYHGTQVSDVIAEAGVARGTFYLYFDSKHAVFTALVDRMLEVFLVALPEEDRLGVRTAAQAEALLRRSYGTVFEAFEKNRDLGRLLFEEAVGADKGFQEKLARHFATWHRRVGETLAAFVKGGVARRDLDVDVTADLVLGMVERTVRRHVFGRGKPDLPRLVDAIVRFELRGVRP
jgi:AcrR family transcriptional regulator